MTERQLQKSKSGQRRSSRKSRAKGQQTELTDERLDEAALYFLQLVVEWKGQNTAFGIPARRELARKLGTEGKLAKVVGDLLLHRDEREHLATLLRVGRLIKHLTGDAEVPLDDAAESFRAAAEMYALPMELRRAREILGAAAKVPRRSRERVIREELFLDFGLVPHERNTMDELLAVLHGGPPKKSAIKSKDEALALVEDIPAHPVDIRPYVGDLLRRAEQLKPGRLKAQ